MAATTAPVHVPSLTVMTPEQLSEQNTNASVENGVPTAAPTHNYRDRLSYQDKWIGWDGPVWCNRYGRFENKEQAAEDDGYKSDSPAPHQGTYSSPLQLYLDYIAV